MNLLQIFFIISAIIIFIVSLDIGKKQKFNALHFLIFLIISWALFVFTILPNILNKIWQFFWLQRWADLLVYSSIIFLLYFSLLLLNKVERNKEDLTKLIRSLAIKDSKKEILKGKEVFIIPCYNEAKVIANTINTILEKWYKNIILVNDWSSDDTEEVLKNYENKIIILNHYKNRWQGRALETGFEYVRKYWNIDYVITFDADLQHDIEDLPKFYKILDENSEIEIVLGSRFIHKKNQNIPFSRKIILKLGILFTYFISSINLTDTHNWYRVFRKETLSKISLSLDGMWHASEILDIIASKNIKFIEVPVEIKYTEYSLSKWQKSSNAISIALNMIWAKFFKN